MCGNGKIESDEECDDGDTDDGDGCSSECEEESTHLCEHKTDPSSVWTDALKQSEFDSVCHEISPHTRRAQTAAFAFSAIATGLLAVTCLL